MQRLVFLSGIIVSALFLVPAAAAADAGKEFDPAALEFFEKKVRPVLAERCFQCHSTDLKKPKGGLFLDSREAVLKGGQKGPAIVPGDPEKSRLVEAVRYQNVEFCMPPRRKLSPEAIADLTTWVKMGAPWPREDAPKPTAPRKDFDLAQRKREHWAWEPVRPQTPPPVRDNAWSRDPVDRFLLAKLEEKGLTPAPAADRRTLLRRLSYDLVGLPPTPEDLEAFVRDVSPDAYEKVVDRLLAAPGFGERWGRHWLDLVRYAESRGHEFDYPIANAYQYRDYVIRALNADVPYNQFVTEHLAGDLLDHPRRHPAEGFNESILGTGFWFLGEELHSPVDTRQDQADRFDNRIDVMTKTFLGLTVACARCHDHKFDALSTRDYYALYGFLESSNYRQARFDTLDQDRELAAELTRLRVRHRIGIQRGLGEVLRPTAERVADYLLAAREALLAGAQPTKVEEIARARKLDAALLRKWVEHLGRAAHDEDDLLHAWAKVAADPAANDPKHLAELLRPLADAERRREAALAASKPDVVIDYGKAGPADWLPDDVAFGTGPLRAGDVSLGKDTARPILRVCERGAAEEDPAWQVLRPAPGSENDPGALAALVRAGRTIRTPDFTVTSGKVYYLVRGHGFAYAAVDAHTMIAGPLHARLVLPIQARERFQWVVQDLTPYQGHHVHVEFTATGLADFAVALVVQGTEPPAPPSVPGAAVAMQLAEVASPEALAAAYQKLLLDALDRLAADHLAGTPEATELAPLANWIVQRPELFAAEDALRKRLVGALAEFAVEEKQLLARIRASSRLAPAMQDGSGVDEHVFIRGSHKAPGELAPRRFLEALAGPEPLGVARGSGRLELARQITDPQLDPFLARVLVNRAWHHLFGRGLVASVDNFGVLGERPTHPELLDHLAERFVREGWSLKRLVRELALSSAYRMSSQPDAQADQADPENLLLHRMRLRRLEGEAIRDTMLTLSGRLNERLYGPPVPVQLTDFQEGRGRPPSGPLDGDGRRSVYLSVRRNFLSSFLVAFDTPTPFSTVGRRTVSNVPAQALILMNDPFVQQQAERWAKRILARSETASERVTRMYLEAFGRPPTEVELGACLEFLKHQAKARLQHPGSEESAWVDLAHVLLNVKEFIYLN